MSKTSQTKKKPLLHYQYKASSSAGLLKYLIFELGLDMAILQSNDRLTAKPIQSHKNHTIGEFGQVRRPGQY